MNLTWKEQRTFEFDKLVIMKNKINQFLITKKIVYAIKQNKKDK